MIEKEFVLFPVLVLKDFCRKSFEKCGLNEEDADLIADTLVKSEMRGVSSHGVVRLPFYCKRLIDKGSKKNPDLKILTEKPAMLLIDGDNGLGQIISVNAMGKVIHKAKEAGICFAGVRNSCHLGMAAYYAMMALDEDMIGLVGSNAPPVMAAWGGKESAIGNNPLSIAVPTAKKFPLVLDISMSVVSGGKVRLAAVEGKKIPFDWILDAKGTSTDRPEDFFPDGTLLPMGHKGFGLAIMIEVLTGALSGAGILSEMGLWFRDTGTPINNGHFFGALDIKTFCDLRSFKERIDRMIDELKSCPLSAQSEEIFMPGEIEFIKEESCRKDGVPISISVLRALDDFASEIKINKLTV